MSLARRLPKTEKTRKELVELAYLHILAQEHNTDSLAKALAVSFPTATRVVEELRRKLASEGGDLVSVKTSKGWHYEIRQDRSNWREDPLWKLIGRVRSPKPRRMKPEDEIIYGRD